MNIIPEWLKAALSDGEHISMSRLLALGTMTTTVFVPAIVWTILSVLQSKLLDMPSGVVGFMSAASAITLAMFAANKRTE